MLVSIVNGNSESQGFVTKEGTNISRREMSALALAAHGFSNAEAAKRFGVNVNTFRNHVYNVMKKLNANSRAHAVTLAIQNGMLIVNDKVDLSSSDFYLCMGCSRVFKWDETIWVEKESIVINHVRLTPPPSVLCPYKDCNGDATYGVEWKYARKINPKYPETPQRGVEYDFDFYSYHTEERNGE